jgi:uncharacterized protein (UPF0332 family)
MSPLLTKSDENINSAELLVNYGYFTSSIHCSYYSLLQRMMYFIEPDFGDNATEGKDSHNRILDLCVKSLQYKNTDKRTIDEFKNNVTQFKRQRRQADYKHNQFNETKSRKAITVSKSLQKILSL